MKKILAISSISLGILVLAGCGSKPAAVAPSSDQTPSATTNQSATPSDTAPSTTAPPASSQDNSAANLPTVPTTTAPASPSDIDNSLNSVNADLNSIDKNAPDANALNNTNIQGSTNNSSASK